MSEFRFQVNLGGMIEILSDHLYSSPDVYIRELLQNAVDAIVAREKKEGADAFAGRINVELLSEEELSFADNGVGLSEEEIHRFLAIIGESSKKELENGQLRSDYIGRFGIGLLSCFMVSDEIRVITRSVHEEKGFEWIGKPDGTYTLETCENPCEVGTAIILKAKKGAKEYFEYDKVLELLMHYGLLLPYPVYLAKGTQKIRSNPVELPWEKEEPSREELMQFGQVMFQTSFMDCIPLHSEIGEASGVAYLLPYTVQASVKQNHMIYLKNMLLTEKGENILPDWAFFTRCIVNAKALRPTASRESFYADHVLEETKKDFGKCISDYLIRLAKEEPQAFRAFLNVHDTAVRSMAVADDELFDIFIDELEFETTRGSMSGRELRLANETLLCCEMTEYRHLSQVFSAQGKLLINVGYVYSRELLQKLAEREELALMRVQADEVEDMLKDVSPMEAESCVDFLAQAEEALSAYECGVEMKRFSPANLPAFYYLDEEAAFYQNVKRQMENADDLFAGMLEQIADSLKDKGNAVLYFNLQNPIIKKLVSFEEEELVRDAVVLLFVQTLLIGGFPLRNNELGNMNDKLMRLLEKCME